MMTDLVVANIFLAGISSFTVTSRIAFAMARDGAFPGSTALRYVYPGTRTPAGAIAMVWAADVAMLLLPLTTMNIAGGYGPIAFNAIVSICTIGLQLSYAIPIWLRITCQRTSFVKTDYNNGALSIPAGFVGAAWLTATCCVFFWPTSSPVNKYNFNYTVVVVGGFSAMAVAWWFAWARKNFKGPVRTSADVAMLAPAPAGGGGPASGVVKDGDEAL